jgi:hypothetical protein
MEGGVWSVGIWREEDCNAKNNWHLSMSRVKNAALHHDRVQSTFFDLNMIIAVDLLTNLRRVSPSRANELLLRP